MIFAVYDKDPGFSAEDQQPGAQRALIAGWLVDYTGDQPTEAEVLSRMSPPNAAIDRQIAALEAQQVRLMTPRARREFDLAVAVALGAINQSGVQTLKNINDQIVALRAQRQ